MAAMTEIDKCDNHGSNQVALKKPGHKIRAHPKPTTNIFHNEILSHLDCGGGRTEQISLGPVTLLSGMSAWPVGWVSDIAIDTTPAISMDADPESCQHSSSISSPVVASLRRLGLFFKDMTAKLGPVWELLESSPMQSVHFSRPIFCSFAVSQPVLQA
jgi:hypothetical protein